MAGNSNSFLKKNGEFHIEIHKDNICQLRFVSKEDVENFSQLEQTVEKSFDSSAPFLNKLAIGTRCGNPCYTLSNTQLFTQDKGVFQKEILHDLSQMIDVVHNQMKLPNYPIAEAVEILHRNNPKVLNFES